MPTVVSDWQPALATAKHYEKAIRVSLEELRQTVKDTDFINTKDCALQVLVPLHREAFVEVLFLCGTKDEIEPMTAYFDQGKEPGPPMLAGGW